jgi:nicotinate-nucleotide pyrophosphorylase (carboxylating)
VGSRLRKVRLQKKERTLNREFTQTVWNESIERDLDHLLSLAISEDLGEAGDLTTSALVPHDIVGQATVAARSAGIIAGLPVGGVVLRAIDSRLMWHQRAADGQSVQAGDPVATIEGPARALLQAERLVLNFLGRLSGIATLTAKYVEAVADTGARIYDTRKTTPGWRRLEKYAVRCGGGNNHRTGLYDAVLIKDNHLALGSRSTEQQQTRFTPAEAVRQARRFIENHAAAQNSAIVEIEVDTLEQLQEVLPAGPDIVLLDNMRSSELREAVALRDEAMRDKSHPAIELEASGGVNLGTVAGIAASGVDRISVGGLTHSAVSLDLGLDWIE